jgi:hypothetical protein
MSISVVYGPEAGPLGEPGPGTLVTDGAPLGLTLRPSNGVAGFSFVCFGP